MSSKDNNITSTGYDPQIDGLKNVEYPPIRNKATSKIDSSVINQNLKAAANEAQTAKPKQKSPSVQMKDVDSMHPPQDETIVAQKFKVKPSPPRSPAPMPDSISPAGVPVNVDIESNTSPQTGSPLRQTITSPLPDGEPKIDIVGLEDLDLSMEGGKTGNYKRNKKGTAIVAFLIFIGLNLFAQHAFMFSWIVRFDSIQTVLAALLYFTSSFFVLGTMCVALVKPSFSIGDKDSLFSYYFLIAVAGLLDLIAILIGGSIFGPFIIYSRISTSYLNMNTMAAILSVLLNAGLYLGFTQPNGSACARYLHPFETVGDQQEQEPASRDLSDEEVKTAV